MAREGDRQAHIRAALDLDRLLNAPAGLPAAVVQELAPVVGRLEVEVTLAADVVGDAPGEVLATI